MRIPEGTDPKLLERIMKRTNIILMLEDMKMMLWGDLVDGKYDGQSAHDIIKTVLNRHQQEFLRLVEAEQQRQAEKEKVPDGTKEN